MTARSRGARGSGSGSRAGPCGHLPAKCRLAGAWHPDWHPVLLCWTRELAQPPEALPLPAPATGQATHTDRWVEVATGCSLGECLPLPAVVYAAAPSHPLYSEPESACFHCVSWEETPDLLAGMTPPRSAVLNSLPPCLLACVPEDEAGWVQVHWKPGFELSSPSGSWNLPGMPFGKLVTATLEGPHGGGKHWMPRSGGFRRREGPRA